MPKFAATLASLLLITSSIGVNIARYPKVGRTLEAEQRTDAAELANSMPSAPQSSQVETAHPDSLPARDIEVQPETSTQVTAVARAEIARTEEHDNTKPAADAAHSMPVSPLPILDVRPLVPVATMRAAAADITPGYDEVRRLPPVESGVPPVADSLAAGSYESQPYPTTSTP